MSLAEVVKGERHEKGGRERQIKSDSGGEKQRECERGVYIYI